MQVVGGSVEDATNASGVYNMYNSSTLLYPEALKEEVEAAALFAAAWGAVDSSTEKLLAEVALQEVHEVTERINLLWYSSVHFQFHILTYIKPTNSFTHSYFTSDLGIFKE